MSVMSRLIAGAMSGTSADGVDVALVRVEGRGLAMTAKLLRHHYRTYDPTLRRAIFAVRETGAASLKDLADLARRISLTYATCVNEALAAERLGANDVAAVAAHGQTLYHAPPDTIQWLDPALLAAETGCAVVSDFRRADCAAGGQGAPLVPFADYILFRDPTKNRVLVNIGGIANVTLLLTGATLERVRAFDTGPGNCISDYVVRERTAGRLDCDTDGRIASTGRVVRELYEGMIAHPFFAQTGPRSTDGPEMIRHYLQVRRQLGLEGMPLEDELATACFITVSQIGRPMTVFGGRFDGELVVSGGGTRNQTMMKMLSEHHGGNPVFSVDQLGVASEAKEAIAFALLGAATLDGEPSNVPSCTGARRRVVLGSITPKP